MRSIILRWCYIIAKYQSSEYNTFAGFIRVMGVSSSSSSSSSPSSTTVQCADDIKEMLEDGDETIIKVYVYTAPLSNFQITQLLLYHAFIILQTESGWWFWWKTTHWWSVEKNTSGIVVQKSKLFPRVAHRCEGGWRPQVWRIASVASAAGRKTVTQLADWLGNCNEYTREYDVVTSNCKHFAMKVYSFLTGGAICILE